MKEILSTLRLRFFWFSQELELFILLFFQIMATVQLLIQAFLEAATQREMKMLPLLLSSSAISNVPLAVLRSLSSNKFFRNMREGLNLFLSSSRFQVRILSHTRPPKPLSVRMNRESFGNYMI